MKRDSQVTMYGIVREWQDSGIAVKHFAQGKGITKTKLEYWIRKFNSELNQALPLPAFVEIGPGVSAIKIPTPKPPHQATEKLQIELTFPSGLCLKIFG